MIWALVRLILTCSYILTTSSYPLQSSFLAIIIPGSYYLVSYLPLPHHLHDSVQLHLLVLVTLVSLIHFIFSVPQPDPLPVSFLSPTRCAVSSSLPTRARNGQPRVLIGKKKKTRSSHGTSTSFNDLFGQSTHQHSPLSLAALPSDAVAVPKQVVKVGQPDRDESTCSDGWTK